MYITANLPPLYGKFNQIRRDNYPFRNAFVSYLETIARLGLSLQMDADLLVGVIEDALLRDDRLPDIPEGTENVKFRFSIENETVETYFKNSELSNKTIVMVVIRMTLRLSAKFGTSLSRLTRMISEIHPDTGAEWEIREPAAPREEKEATGKPAVPGIRITKKEPKRPEAEPALDLSRRLENLTKRAEEVLESAEAESEGIPVVETNPFLNDFL